MYMWNRELLIVAKYSLKFCFLVLDCAFFLKKTFLSLYSDLFFQISIDISEFYKIM